MSKATAAPFPIHASDDALEDLERRLASTRWPAPADPGWTLGTDPVWLRDLVDYWRNEFDWRSQEDWLNATLPGQRAHVRGIDVHFSHRPGRDPAALPLLLLHGWPSSFVEMHRIVGPLSDPTDHGLGGGPRFDVVVGSLPGHGFSSAPSDPAFGADECADVFRDLMVDVLGYERFAIHGGDRGAFVATSLGHRHPEHVAAIHQTLPLGIPDSPPSAEERAWLEEVEAWSREEGGYSALQATRPLSLAYGLNDSPVGLAAWICEKFFAWADCDDDPLEVFTRDELLVNVMIYWLSGSIYPSARFYWAHRHAPPAAIRPVRIEVPTGICLFPKEVMRPPRSAVARKYDLRHWREPLRGGHFPALEAPHMLVEDLREFLEPFVP
ncbi:MAG: alpha/beta fold hydrolase [Spirochaetaceae bacterium]|nr:alpha/beta fold hydrolase [Myxococcales bacterium]MCB9725476.1 alpha/beta fold hydrolase [Spirochaetaceae bacterium]